MILRLTGLVVLGAIVGLALWIVGLRIPYAVASGILVAAGGILMFARATAPEDAWHALPDDHPRGTRDDMARVSWSLHAGQAGVSDAALIRVRRLMDGRLTRRAPESAGANPMILDERNARALARAGGMTVTRRDIESILDQLDDPNAQEKP